MDKFEQKYNHKDVEKKWQDTWYNSDLYYWNDNISKSDSFIIDTPPPTVSGILHMGHIFSYTQTDFIARYQRMCGKNVFYPMGFDDNGLPTERLVEKTFKLKANSIPRNEFQTLCYKVIDEAEQEFYKLFCGIALSVDWRQKYQTISNTTKTLSQMSFIDLYEKNEIYRTLEPSLWDPTDKTALAQADLEEIEMKGIMNTLSFKLEDGNIIKIATTRPELLPACVAVFFHPEDTRYTYLKNKHATTPIFGTNIPLIADDQVQQDKGTGLVMCCTFGDTKDIEWWKKHKLPTRIILTKNGTIDLRNKLENSSFDFEDTKILQNAVEKLEGQNIQSARQIMIELLDTQGYLIEQEHIKRPVKCAERSKTPVEIIVTPQWFIRILDKKHELLKKSQECNWNPPYMSKRLEHWIDGLNWDWCISRQRFFGIQFPVWYSKRKGEEGKIIVATKEQLPIDPITTAPTGYSLDEVEPDYDVMDTWATSSITPQLNAHAINNDFTLNKDRYNKLFPADMRPQAHEIIRTWTFYTMAKSLLHSNSLPWKNTVISGWVLAADKTKMSKSKGNIITPHELIEESSADVIRYWASTSKLGNDIAYSDQMFQIGKKLITKLWNASKFVLSHINGHHATAQFSHLTDKWILSKLHNTVREASREMNNFEYCTARTIIETFFWKDFCDTYLELIKVRVYDQNNTDPEGKISAINTLHFLLNTILKLFAPFLPHITEEIHNIIFSKTSIHSKYTWPQYTQIACCSQSEKLGDIIVAVLELIRKFKTEQKMSLKTELDTVHIITTNQDTADLLTTNPLTDLKNAANTKKICINSKSIIKNDSSKEISNENFKLIIYT
ncbi:MAG: valine--tRNA ligase [Rickettsiales bacterium]|nr:valine--tRNA ligase [Rickettsiales bacterium]